MESNASILGNTNENDHSLHQQHHELLQHQYHHYNGVSSISNNETTRKKTWSELRDSVSELRKVLSKLTTVVPMNIEFRNLSDGRTRIYFLSTPPNGWETTLLCTDIPQLDGLDANVNPNQRQRYAYTNDIFEMFVFF